MNVLASRLFSPIQSKKECSGYSCRYSIPLHHAMAHSDLTQPLTFEPIFMERIWGGRRLQSVFGKNLPENRKIGEAWEIVDRPEAQSIVRHGTFRGTTLHDLWMQHRRDIFGDVPDAPRFPILIKLLDAQDKLSLQVHPPAAVAKKTGGEPKTEFWYVAKADPGAAIFVGLREPISADDFKRSIEDGTIPDRIHSIPVQAGDAMFLPAGRFHAIGAGNLLVEIQQNSDSTYRVFDWNRTDDQGHPRALHVDLALESIDFNDCQPELVRANGEVLVRHELFEVQKWTMTELRSIAPRGQFAIVSVLEGVAEIAGLRLKPGEFCLVPAGLAERDIRPVQGPGSILRITIPT
jgi:mannose-6-phosphate isomerase